MNLQLQFLKFLKINKHHRIISVEKINITINKTKLLLENPNINEIHSLIRFNNNSFIKIKEQDIESCSRVKFLNMFIHWL